jgi:Fe-S-cluster-containing dehydrogenase component/DMSO reductase anchor subunit
MRTGFIFDLNKCVGCEACVVACQIENHGIQTELWRSVHTFNTFRHPSLPLFSLSLACNHCDDPLCLSGCPANAFCIDPVYHTVDHTPDHCIGCRYCTWMCPYDAPKYAGVKGSIEKCTLCKERIVAGGMPNCANLCPTGALEYGEVDSRAAIDVPGFTDKGIWPAIRVIPLRRKNPPLHATSALSSDEQALFKRMSAKTNSKSSLKSEWPLIAFTMIAAFLVATASASLFGDSPMSPTGFMAFAIAGLIISALHLGKPHKAWRALLNVRSSWLSREIALFSLFVILSGSTLALSLPMPFMVASALTGVAALVAIDMVYAVVEGVSLPSIRSGSVLMSGLLFFAVLVQISFLLAALLLLSCGFYMRGLLREGRHGGRRLFSAVRIAVGFLLPLILLFTQQSSWILAFCVATGEVINRAEFYLDLDIITPGGQIQKDIQLGLALPAMEKL